MACDKIAGPHRLYYAPFQNSGAIPTFNVNMYLGLTGEEGIRQTREGTIQDITSDELGPGTIVDGVYQGANLELEFVVQDVNKEVVQQIMYPFQHTFTSGNVSGVMQEAVGVPGVLACSRFGTLWALPVEDTPAADVFNVGDNVTLTNNGRRYTGISVGPIVENLDTNLRMVPIRFRCYPYLEGGIWKQWTWVANTLDD